MHPKSTPNCVCQRCGKAFYRSPSRVSATNYCSPDCMRHRVQFTCEVCGSTFEKPASSARYHTNKYCSVSCKRVGAKVNPTQSVLARVDRSAGPDACWPYTGSQLPKGYGSYKYSGGHLYAHRVAFEEAYGPIPDGLFVLHTCDNPPCCNPAHLFLGTHQENMDDAAAKERMKHGSRHHNSRLTEDDVREIRRLSRDLTGRALAARFRVSPSTIGRVIRGDLWRHVTPHPENRR